jgi:hypothetical protein
MQRQEVIAAGRAPLLKSQFGDLGVGQRLIERMQPRKPSTSGTVSMSKARTGRIVHPQAGKTPVDR